jgi:hypothetical protein
MADLTYTPSGKITSGNIKSELSAEEIKARADAAKPFVAKGNAGTTGMPKQAPGESMSAYSTKMRLWREANATPAVEGQKKALKEMASK